MQSCEPAARVSRSVIGIPASPLRAISYATMLHNVQGLRTGSTFNSRFTSNPNSHNSLPTHSWSRRLGRRSPQAQCYAALSTSRLLYPLLFCFGNHTREWMATWVELTARDSVARLQCSPRGARCKPSEPGHPVYRDSSNSFLSSTRPTTLSRSPRFAN